MPPYPPVDRPHSWRIAALAALGQAGDENLIEHGSPVSRDAPTADRPEHLPSFNLLSVLGAVARARHCVEIFSASASLS